MFESDFFGVAGFFLSVIAIPITFIVARRTRLRPEIRYAIDHDVLVEPKAELIDRGLSIRFADQTLRQVSRTYVALWNHRGDTIKGSDILFEDPLRVQLQDLDAVVDVSVVWYSRDQNRLTVRCDPADRSAATIDFDFLDAGDGAVIQIVHEQGSPALAGTIRGCGIRDKGSGDLTESTLSQVKSKSLLKRIARRDGGPSLLPALLMVLLAATTAFIEPILSFFRDPRKLVDSSKYDLTSLKGQDDFAEKVMAGRISSEGPYLDWLMLGFGAMFLAIFILVGYSRARRFVPVSILRHRAEDHRPAAADLPGRARAGGSS
ncbi:hypothetical protein [Plantactinospora soyae]|uniref:Uncharacterized protein n=1 Tax=Plantactinospora soyae TaxID=1544732 RepID=A0A927R4Q7_9ACTN|nr:hypothetical protein [Plantactinospora soyae]MBE1485206.1 hypothetical protein [Plantactinospora soyae]